MSQRVIAFAIAVIFSMFFCPVIVSAQLPNKTLEKFSTAEWTTYSREVLHKADPEDAVLIDRTRIVITKNIMTNAKSYWWLNPEVLVINYGIIWSVDSEDEYRSILLHEFGHLKLKQFPPITIDDDGEEVIDLKLFFEQERAADEFAQKKMVDSGHDGCAGYLIAKKIFGFPNLNDPGSRIDFKRLELMLNDCKESMPHIPGKADPGPR